MQKLISLLIAFILFVTNGVVQIIQKSNEIPPAKALEDISDVSSLRTFDIAEEIDVASAGSQAQLHALAILEGLAARDKISIVIDYGAPGTREALSLLSKQGKTVSRTDENGKAWNLLSLLEKYADKITDKGFTVFDVTEAGEQINMAVNYAIAYGYAAVPRELAEDIKALGFTEIADMKDVDCSAKGFYKFFKNNRDAFSSDGIVHQLGEAHGLRDLAVQQGFFTMWVSESDTIDVSYRQKVFKELNTASPVLGWTDAEVKYTEKVSEAGLYVVPSDHCYNNSLLCSVKADAPAYENAAEEITADAAKHYIALVCSDGDNVQWIQNGYALYYNKIKAFDDFKTSWTLSPSLRSFSEVDYSLVTSAAGKNNTFVSGVSGLGYINPSKMSDEALEEFTDKTAKAMAESGLDIITILDKAPKTAVQDKAFEKTLGYYSRYDNIKGGVLELDPDRYQSGKGRIRFSDGKPFVSVRLSLWNNDGPEAVTKEWLEQQAAAVNSYKADIHSADGYSVINIHPWSMDADDIAYFVSCLDENVEIVSADELIALITENVSA